MDDLKPFRFHVCGCSTIAKVLGEYPAQKVLPWENCRSFAEKLMDQWRHENHVVLRAHHVDSKYSIFGCISGNRSVWCSRSMQTGIIFPSAHPIRLRCYQPLEKMHGGDWPSFGKQIIERPGKFWSMANVGYPVRQYRNFLFRGRGLILSFWLL